MTLDERVLRRIDQEARRRGVSRSALVGELAARGLGVPVGPGADPSVQRAIERIQELAGGAPAGDSTALIRAMRDGRWGS